MIIVKMVNMRVVNQLYYLIISLLPHTIRERLNNSNERSKRAFNNIIVSVFAKCISIITPLLIVPLTIGYINVEQYGIWLTLSSLVAWMSVLDLGLGHGFRNKFAESRANGDDALAKRYVSTTYFTIACIVLFAYICLLLINTKLDWARILKVDASINSQLRQVVAIICSFFSLRMVVNLFGTMLIANQQPGLSSLITGASDVCSLITIFILTKTTEGSLVNLALYYSGVPCFVMLLVSIYSFTFTKYRAFAPRFSAIDISLIKNIVSLGIQFFVINLSMIAVFQIINIVLSREIGPVAVTQYNVTHKYYGILHSMLLIIVTPFWSAFTDAFTKKDYQWMRTSLRSLETIWLVAFFIGLMMFLLSPLFFKIWLKDSVDIPIVLSAAMMCFLLSQSLGGIYMMLINGIGSIRIQLIIYVFFAFISWPLLVASCRYFGIYGIVFIPSLVYIVQALLGRLQLKKLLTGNAMGIWSK